MSKSSSNTRYFVFSKRSYERTGIAKPMKNVATREEARDYKRSQSNPVAYGIMDRWAGETVR